MDPRAQPKWTIAKEIFLGSLPLIVAIISFGGLLYGNQRAMEVRIDQLERADVRQQDAATAQRVELIAAITRLGSQMEAVQQAVARLSARDESPPRRLSAMPYTPSTR